MNLVVEKNGYKTQCPTYSQQLLTSVFEVKTVRKYSLMLCQSCQLVFSLPRPKPEQLDSAPGFVTTFLQIKMDIHLCKSLL